MTIRHLKVFIEVAEKGKMSAAAEALYITQPSVSQAIRELEEHYTTLLFERLSKRLYITEAGKLLYGYAKQVVSQFDLMEDNMAPNNLKEKLRIGATLTVGGSILSPLVKDFREDHPEINIFACVDNTQDIEQKLLNMELDVAIVEGQVKHHDLVSVPLIKDRLVLACSNEHPFAGRASVSIHELEGQEFVMREPGSGTRELFEKYLEKHKIKIHTVFEEHSPDSIRKAVLINNCLTVISPRLLESELRENKVYIFVNARQDWNRSFSFVYHKDKFLTPSIRHLQDLVTSYGEHEVLADIPAGRLTASA